MFPDQGKVLSNSLYYYSRYCLSEDVYRLFLAAPGFDVDIDDPSNRHLLLKNCPDPRCFNVIVAHQDPEFFGRPIAARFDLAVELQMIQLSGFCEILGRTDGELAHLRCSKNGWTPLHYVAYGLYELLEDGSDFKEGLDFGVSLLRNGADPCSIPIDVVGQDRCPLTPLLRSLGADSWPPRVRDIPTGQRAIDDWINMLQEAGIDLLECGTRESKIWESLKSGNCTEFEETENWGPHGAPGLQVERLLYGPTPTDWGFEFCRFLAVRVHQLQKMPGTYSSRSDIPDRIWWTPTEVEEAEGPWKVIGTKTLASAPVDSRLYSRSREPFLGLVDDTQHDTGVIALVQQRAHLRRKEEPTYRRRSISQPPILRRREVAYYARQEPENRRWLDRCHLCPFDSRWKFGCHGHSHTRWEVLSDNHPSDLFDVRSCVRGVNGTRIHLFTHYQEEGTQVLLSVPGAAQRFLWISFRFQSLFDLITCGTGKENPDMMAKTSKNELCM
ncbi:hypothetical protein LTR47_008015 [Exophiala xenobiotica]|nr:hypothetical protein LTR47_008015 [Exophiala xenobiotica]KAK5253043.1 hypothetical protein LTS06_002502 [Exophiala xenobiotica]KAK5357059.1 hypothetical protein LTR61_000796 [Exophiala xenobiotica]KAK5377213.1 hypothetical protein LTR11_004879 [Exophiala xenobiotica]KAK5379350.1 hypothetical protein LTS03_004228 [Exophiala xenobiotica]